MAQLNEFIESNIAKMRALFQQLSVVDDSHIGGGGGGGGNGREEALAAALAAEQVRCLFVLCGSGLGGASPFQSRFLSTFGMPPHLLRPPSPLCSSFVIPQVEVPRKVVEEAAARLYSFVDLNLERILTSMVWGLCDSRVFTSSLPPLTLPFSFFFFSFFFSA